MTKLLKKKNTKNHSRIYYDLEKNEGIYKYVLKLVLCVHEI